MPSKKPVPRKPKSSAARKFDKGGADKLPTFEGNKKARGRAVAPEQLLALKKRKKFRT